jgi:DNA-nicking Smr family endonuclease
MDQANTKASKLIIEGQDWMRSGELDLHGLFLQEALAATHMFLEYWIRNRRDTVLIITGAGHHSKHKYQPVLRPKVVALLQERVHKNGALLVSLRPRQ